MGVGFIVVGIVILGFMLIALWVKMKMKMKKLNDFDEFHDLFPMFLEFSYVFVHSI